MAGHQWEAAERHFAEAELHAKRMNNRLEETELRRLRARMLLDRDDPGDRARAAELLREALIDCQPRGWGVGLPTLRRFFLIGSFYGPFRLGLLSVLSRLRSGGTDLSPRCRNFGPFTGNAKLSGTGVQVPFPVVELRPGRRRSGP
jgi:hypothetical protein